MSAVEEGVVFGYLCSGRWGTSKIYRFGRTKRTTLDERIEKHDRTKVAIERLGRQFGGLNSPECVVVWRQVEDMRKAWEMARDYLRNHIFIRTDSKRPLIIQESSLGDNFFSIEGEQQVADFEIHIKEAFEKMFTDM